ncbi:hypothetical protein [Simkania sp.]|uniref:hypothetical protein n=1 Tax=Simkania sp. TaxID=34094 RepID=UPI003B52AA4D
MSVQLRFTDPFNSLQLVVLESNEHVLDVTSYLEYDSGKVFPNHLSALNAVNQKARTLLDKFVAEERPSSDTVKHSFLNLVLSSDKCHGFLKRMAVSDVDILNGSFQSVEFYVTGLNSERIGQDSGEVPRQTTTLPDNVQHFRNLVAKTNHYRNVFEDIQRLSRWPKYRDIIVERKLDGTYSVSRPSKYRAMEFIAFGVIVLIGLAYLVFNISNHYFPTQASAAKLLEVNPSESS